MMTDKNKFLEVIVAPGVAEEGEEELTALIKLAGEDARVRKQKVMERHFQMIKDIVEKNIIQQQRVLLK